MDESPPPDIPQPVPPQPLVAIPPDQFQGRWANDLNLSVTKHEVTLDTIRMGPMGQYGEVVSRVSFSPLLFAKMVDILNEAWKDYVESSGVPT